MQATPEVQQGAAAGTSSRAPRTPTNDWFFTESGQRGWVSTPAWRSGAWGLAAGEGQLQITMPEAEDALLAGHLWAQRRAGAGCSWAMPTQQRLAGPNPQQGNSTF